jgi:tetratricopeptide (TPR) repeat protein
MQSILIKYKFFLVAGLLMLALSWASYSGNDSHKLLLWDDEPYITENNWVTNPSLDSVRSLFTEPRVGNWHPLTWLSYIPEYYFCETNANCYKNTNIVLHGANSFLVFLLSGLVLSLLLREGDRSSFKLGDLTDRRVFIASLMSGILFCVHPHRAESVIWVAERKDLLSALFYFLALIFYICQQNSASLKTKLLPFVFFILAIMSKSMAITLPAVLVLLDFTLLDRWNEKSGEGATKARFRIAIIEKLHYHMVAVLIAAVTLLSQEVGRVDQPTLFERLAISVAAIEHYVVSLVAPINLSPFYPMETLSMSILDYWQLAIVLVFALALLPMLIYSRKGKRVATLFVGYFLITLAPVIGIVKVGDQIFADRYTYLTMVGFYILAAYGLSKMLNANQRFRIPAFLGFTVLAGLLSFNTHQYKNTWQDDITLWRSAERLYPNLSVTISNNLGYALLSLEDYPLAQQYFEMAIDVDPHRPGAYVNLTSVHQQLGDTESFLNTYILGVENNPENPGLITSAGFGFLAYGLNDEALEYFITALELELNFPPAIMGVGNLMLMRGELENAISMFELVPPNSDVFFPARLLMSQAYGHSDREKSLAILEDLRVKYGRDEEIDSVVEFVVKIDY